MTKHPIHQRQHHHQHQQQHQEHSNDTPSHRFLTSTGTIASSTPNGFLPSNNNSFGLLITLQKRQHESSSSTTTSTTKKKDHNNHNDYHPYVLQLEFVPDQNQPHIHPNSYAPAAFTNVHKLGGGGSGVAVFEGTNPYHQVNEHRGHSSSSSSSSSNNQVVMKHGSDKDLVELFALATVTRELAIRAKAFGHEQAAQSIQQRIPEFRFIYISPHHLGEKRKALWKRLATLYEYSNNSWLDPLEEEEDEDEDEQEEENKTDEKKGNNGDDYDEYDENAEEEGDEEDEVTEHEEFSEWDDSVRFALEDEAEAATLFGGDAGEDCFNMLKRNSSATAFQTLQLQQRHQVQDHVQNQLQHDYDQEHHRFQPVDPHQQVQEQEQDQDQQYPMQPHHHYGGGGGGGVPNAKNTMMPFGVAISKSGTISGHRDIALVSATKPPYQRSPKCSVQLIGDSLTIVLPEDQYAKVHVMNHSSSSSSDSDKTTVNPRDIRDSKIQITGMSGYSALQALVEDLLVLMRENKWKFTLGQKKIGQGDAPKTGNQWLYDGKLHGRLLDNLISQKIQLVRDLTSLTTPAEQDPRHLQQVQEEMTMLEEKEEEATAALQLKLSDQADSFAGYAVKKNFREESGRFPVLLLLGKRFREHSRRRQEYLKHNMPTTTTATQAALVKRSSWGSETVREAASAGASPPSNSNNNSLILTPQEELPAHHLGSLTRPGALMGDTFENVPGEPCFLDSMNPFYWRNLLHFAVRRHQPQQNNPSNHHQRGRHVRTSDMAMKRLWTCGLTDAGLHNLFLTEDKLWLFDLGEPQLYSVPGFLTKFLFSFFHTLGMEEMPEAEAGVWVQRFEPNTSTGKLRLTQKTITLLSKAYDAFEIALDRLIDELFQGDDSLRWLLIQFVTLQLLSDASFCLQKWTIKGGGRTRDSNHQEGIEKWLWRALWDIYVAFDINSQETWYRLKVEHPSNLESMEISPFLMRKIIDSKHMKAGSMIDQLAITVEDETSGSGKKRGFHLNMREEPRGTQMEEVA